MDVLDSIHNWIINLEYHDKHRTIISQIKIQGSPVLHTLLFEYWTSYHNFGPLNFYSSTRYEWAHRLSKKYPCGLRTKTTLDQKKTRMTYFILAADDHEDFIEQMNLPSTVTSSHNSLMDFTLLIFTS